MVTWSPHLKGEIDKVERVQRRATKQVPSLKNMTYPERLKKLELTTLRFRRLRGDMVETYKIYLQTNMTLIQQYFYTTYLIKM